MSQTNIIIIFLLMWVNIICNYMILSSMIKRIESRLSRLEILGYFKGIESKEEKEEKTLQKKDKDV